MLRIFNRFSLKFTADTLLKALFYASDSLSFQSLTLCQQNVMDFFSSNNYSWSSACFNYVFCSKIFFEHLLSVNVFFGNHPHPPSPPTEATTLPLCIHGGGPPLAQAPEVPAGRSVPVAAPGLRARRPVVRRTYHFLLIFVTLLIVAPLPPIPHTPARGARCAAGPVPLRGDLCGGHAGATRPACIPSVSLHPPREVVGGG